MISWKSILKQTVTKLQQKILPEKKSSHKSFEAIK